MKWSRSRNRTATARLLDAADVAERIAADFTHPLLIADSEHFVTASVGIAIADHGHEQPEALIRDADAAMYRAKKRGRALRALRRGHASTRGGAPARGARAPPRAGARRALALSAASAGTARRRRCRQPVRPAGRPARPLRVRRRGAAVHGPAGELPEPGDHRERPPRGVREPHGHTGRPPRARCAPRPRRLRHRLFLAGLLKPLQLDTLKIDRSFVGGLGTSRQETAIVHAVVGMAHALSLSMVAEGIETHGQLAELRRLRCDSAQGCLFSRPLPADEVGALLAGQPLLQL